MEVTAAARTADGHDIEDWFEAERLVAREMADAVVASTHGNVPAGVKINAQDVIVGVNAYIKK